MADEEQNVADDAAGGASDKSTKKKTVKKATKKSVKKKAVKKKAVKKATKKSVKKKAVKSTASAAQGSVVASNNGQKEKAKIRLKDDAAKAEKAQMAASSTIVKPPVKQKKDGLGLLSTLSIALLVIVGIWTVVSYMSSDDGVTTELKTDTATEAAPATVPVAPAPIPAEPAEIVPAQLPMQPEERAVEDSVTESKTESVVDTARKTSAAETDVNEKTAPADRPETARESKSFFESIFGRKEEPAEETSAAAPAEETSEIVTEETVTEETAVPPTPVTETESMPQPYRQPAPWGAPPGYGRPPFGQPMQPAPWGAPGEFGPPEDFGPPPGYYEEMPESGPMRPIPPMPPMPEYGTDW